MINLNYQNEINANYYFARYDEILYNLESNMRINQTTNNITLDFIRCMLPCNNSLILICENLNKYTKDISLKNFSDNIINSKKRENEYMNEVYNNMIPYVNSKREVDSYFKRYFRIFDNMFNHIKNSPRTINIDYNFINELIPYYEGVIKLSQNIVKCNIDPRIGFLVNNIIMESNNQINILKQVNNNFRNNMI